MKSYTLIHLVHIAIIGGFLLYVGIAEKNTPVWAFRALFVTGIIVSLYHSYLYYKQGEELATRVFHACLIAPLLVWVGVMQQEASHEAFRFVLMAAFASIGYHAYALIRYS
jgi:hypothetical protein